MLRIQIHTWIRIRNSEFTDPDQDPGSQLFTDPLDPDPEHWFNWLETYRGCALEPADGDRVL